MRGGFLFLDDFHGEREWQHAQEQLRMILPDYKINDLPLSERLLFESTKVGFHDWFRFLGRVTSLTYAQSGSSFPLKTF